MKKGKNILKIFIIAAIFSGIMFVVMKIKDNYINLKSDERIEIIANQDNGDVDIIIYDKFENKKIIYDKYNKKRTLKNIYIRAKGRRTITYYDGSNTSVERDKFIIQGIELYNSNNGVPLYGSNANFWLKSTISYKNKANTEFSYSGYFSKIIISAKGNHNNQTKENDNNKVKENDNNQTNGSGGIYHVDGTNITTKVPDYSNSIFDDNPVAIFVMLFFVFVIIFGVLFRLATKFKKKKKQL